MDVTESLGLWKVLFVKLKCHILSLMLEENHTSQLFIFEMGKLSELFPDFLPRYFFSEIFPEVI